MIAKNMEFLSDRGSGQANVIKTLLTFAMGVAIMAGIFFVFNSMQSNVLGDIRTPQSMEVLNYVAAASSNLVKLNATSSYFIITLPKKIGNSAYTISGNGYDKRIMLISPESSISVSSPAPFGGTFQSTYETAIIRYESGRITIGGVSD